MTSMPLLWATPAHYLQSLAAGYCQLSERNGTRPGKATTRRRLLRCARDARRRIGLLIMWTQPKGHALRARLEFDIELLDLIGLGLRGFGPFDHRWQFDNTLAIGGTVAIERHVIGAKACNNRCVHGVRGGERSE